MPVNWQDCPNRPLAFSGSDSDFLPDVTHPFFKINELQLSEFATFIDSSERLRNSQLLIFLFESIT
jgi:hypothetical protein